MVTRRAACFAALTGAIPGRAQTGAALVYQKRGRYSEGLRGAPSTGVPLDLVAAMVDCREPYTQLPPQFQALVFVPQAQPVYLTIREVEPEYYYWLDNAQPESGWRPGKVNRFGWPTGTVIRYLTQRDRPLRLNDLGSVARLGSDVPATPDVILPVALYHSTPPAEALGYRFIFRPGAGVHLTFTLAPDGSGAPVGKPQEFPEIGAGEAQAVSWNSAGWPDGWYRISVSGYKLSDNTRIDQRVRFYHRRTLGG